MVGECTRAALCHLFMSRWFRVWFERWLAAASGLTLTEVGSNADGQVPVQSCVDCAHGDVFLIAIFFYLAALNASV
jgi:hypothetical protein